MAIHGSWTMPWATVGVSEEQTESLSAIERLCECPILSSGKASSDALAAAEDNGNTTRSLREWYIECANEPPVEAPLVKKTVLKVQAMRRFEDQVGDEKR